MIGEPVIVDVHAHMLVRRFEEIVAAIDGRTFSPPPAIYPLMPPGHTVMPPSSDSPEDVEARIQLMDAAGVQVQILSQVRGGHENLQIVEAMQATNDSYAALARAYPDRFRAYAALPLPHVKESVREFQRAMDDLGAVGACLPCLFLRKYSPTDPEFAAIFEEADRRGAPIYFHPRGGGSPVVEPLSEAAGLANGLEAPLEDTLLIANLLTRKFATRYPNIKFVVAHLGGAIPMLVERIQHESTPNLSEPVDEPLSKSMQSFYYDTVTHFSTPAIKVAWMEFGADHLMAGSDYPITLYFGRYKENFEAIERLDVPASDIEMIFSGTAKDVLDLNL